MLARLEAARQHVRWRKEFAGGPSIDIDALLDEIDTPTTPVATETEVRA